MTLLSTIGFLIGFSGAFWIPLPKWRLLTSLVALGMVISAGDFLIMMKSPHHSAYPIAPWIEMIAGAFVGLGSGYFANWILELSLQRTAGIRLARLGSPNDKASQNKGNEAEE